MYHSFLAVPKVANSEASKQNADQNQRRGSSTTRACDPCRHRKVKCSGDLPCETCQYYRKSAECRYTDPAQKATSSKRPGDKATQTLLRQYRNVFQRLFPGLQPDQLAELSREQLLDLMMKDSPRHFLPANTPLTPSTEEIRPQSHPDAGGLETFQPIPEEGSETSDQRPIKALEGVQDDVNALSLSVKPTSSYLGISSVMAVLRIIVWLDPEAQTIFKRTPAGSTASSRDVTSPSTPMGAEEFNVDLGDSTTSAWDEIPHINAYFTFFHPMVPLLDEQTFRDTYMTRSRTDSRWMLLLNIVLSLGSAVNGTTGDASHRLYYLRAQRHLTLQTFGMVHLETVQALALLSGYYLHYLQLPNQANSMMGATLRMATALGLHRDYSESVAFSNKERAASSAELRCRIWWCIICLDSWASISLGRPSMGRINHANTAKIPLRPIGNSVQIVKLLQENIQFALISTKEEDALAYSPILDENERKTLDTAYMDWFKSSTVHDDTPRPSAAEPIGISVMKAIMRWRYLWCRIVLHRPILLWCAMRKMPFSDLPKDRQTTVELCRDLTGELISDIAFTWAGRNRSVMSAWHATWLMYQATMVPLLALFSDSNDRYVLEKSHSQIQIAIKVLSDQIDYTHTAKRSLEVVSLIYEAGKLHRPKQSETQAKTSVSNNIFETANNVSTFVPQLQPSDLNSNNDAHPFMVTHNLDTPQQEMMMDNMFDSLKWSTGWVDGSNDWVDFDRLGVFWKYIEPDSEQDQVLSSSNSTYPNFDFNNMESGSMDLL